MVDIKEWQHLMQGLLIKLFNRTKALKTVLDLTFESCIICFWAS